MDKIVDSPFEPFSPRLLALQQILEYLVEIELLSPLEEKTNDMFRQMKHANATGAEIIQLIAVHRKELEEGASPSPKAIENFFSILSMA